MEAWEHVGGGSPVTAPSREVVDVGCGRARVAAPGPARVAVSKRGSASGIRQRLAGGVVAAGLLVLAVAWVIRAGVVAWRENPVEIVLVAGVGIIGTALVLLVAVFVSVERGGRTYAARPLPSTWTNPGGGAFVRGLDQVSGATQTVMTGTDPTTGAEVIVESRTMWRSR